jgi:1-acyl-sn-glycerol-3-phosphate acyltransferase
MRTLLVVLALIVLTPLLGTLVIVAALLGVEDRDGGVFEWAPRLWSKVLLAMAGVRVVLHDAHRMDRSEPRIYVSNHVSWFDVLTLAAVLPRYKFVGKAELFRIPLFGAAARATGMIPIERENRKAAFHSYELAASRIRGGASVVVFPEGTRGRTYALRPFKKGPFVLAASAQAPIIPTVVHGTIHVLPRGSLRARAGTIDVRFLEPIETRGMTYHDRDRLSVECWDRMAEALRREYGVDSVSPDEENDQESGRPTMPGRGRGRGRGRERANPATVDAPRSSEN